MGEQWHLLRSGSQSGPHSFEELQRLLAGVNPDREQILVWTEQLKDWTDPRKVPGLTAQEPPADAGAGFAPAAPFAGSAPAHAASQSQPDLSSLNPYETPASALARPSAPPAGELGNHELDVGACLGAGWKLTTSHFGKLILFGLAYLGVIIAASIPLSVLQAIGAALDNAIESAGVGVAFLIVSILLQLALFVFEIYLWVGATIFGLGILRGMNPSISVLFSGRAHLISFGVAWLVTLAVVLPIALAGFVLPEFLPVPSSLKAVFWGIGFVSMIYLSWRLSQAPFAIVDQKLGPVSGLKASWVITKGNFWRLLLMWVVSMGILIVGVLALGVGLLWAIPTLILTWVAAYLCMSRGVGALPRFD